MNDDRMWTPYILNVLLHHYAHCDEFPYSPIRSSVFNELRDLGLMTPEGARPPQTWTLTDKGRCFVEDGLLRTPLPIWSIPR